MLYLPRGPVYDNAENGCAPDVHGDAYAQRMKSWRDSAFEEATQTAALSMEAPRIQTYINYIEGNQWDSRRARYKSKFYLNKTGKAREDNLALLTDSRPAIEVGSRVEQYIKDAKVIDNVLRAEWTNQDMDLSLVQATDIAQVTGTGFWKLGAARPGMMRVTPCGPDAVMPIQPGFHIQQSTAVMYRTWKSLTEVMRKFPMRAADLERESRHTSTKTQASYVNPGHLDQYTWNGLSPQMKRMIGRRSEVSETFDSGVFRTVEWQEYYIDDLSTNDSSRTIVMKDPYLQTSQHNWWYEVKPGERLYPRKRLVIYAGQCLIYDGPSPFWHGLFPFSCLRLNPVFWSFWGLSKYRDLLPVNSAINEVVAGILDACKKALNQTYIAKGASVPRAAWNEFFPDVPGQKLYLQGTAANPASDIRALDPPNLPAYVFQLLSQYLGPEFDKLAGTLDIAAVGGKKQVPGGDTLEQMRDSAQTSVRLQGRYMETFLRDAGIQGVSNVIQFYDAPQRMRLLGPDGVSFSDYLYDPKDMVPSAVNKFEHWKNFPMTVVPGSLHGGSKDRSKMMMMSLRQTGNISRRKLLESLDINDIDRIQQELREEMQDMAEAQQGAQLGGAMPRMSRGQRNGLPM
jgi:hypothetical protein